MDGLLSVHKRIVDVDTDSANAPSGAGGIVCTRLLVAANQAGVLIGKQGATIKSIQDASSCTIRILGGGAFQIISVLFFFFFFGTCLHGTTSMSVCLILFSL